MQGKGVGGGTVACTADTQHVLFCKFGFLQYAAALSVSLIVGQVMLSSNLEKPLGMQAKKVELALAILRLCSFNTEISLLYVYAFASNLLFLDLIGPVLTKWTMLLHVITSTGFTAPFIVGYANGKLFSLCTLYGRQLSNWQWCCIIPLAKMPPH